MWRKNRFNNLFQDQKWIVEVNRKKTQKITDSLNFRIRATNSFENQLIKKIKKVAKRICTLNEKRIINIFGIFINFMFICSYNNKLIYFHNLFIHIRVLYKYHNILQFLLKRFYQLDIWQICYIPTYVIFCGITCLINFFLLFILFQIFIISSNLGIFYLFLCE